MRIRFEMSGGYGGLFAREPLSCLVDTDSLPAEEAAELARLVQGGRLEETEPAPSPPAVRDAMTYRLQVTDGGRTVERAFDDVTMPAAVRPLVEHMKGRALRQRGV